MSEIPSLKPRWNERKLLKAVLITPIAVIGTSYGAYTAVMNPATAPVAWALVLALFLVLANGFVEIANAMSEDRKKSPRDSLYGCMSVLQAVIARRVGLKDTDVNALRVTFHKVCKPGDGAKEFEQLTPYIGGDGGEPGRKFSVLAGVAGKAVRTGKPEVLLFDSALSHEERLAELQDRWGYSQRDGRVVVSTGRLSFLGMPIFLDSSKKAIGVVYLDSTREGLFDEDNIRLTMDACHGVATFVEGKYFRG